MNASVALNEYATLFDDDRFRRADRNDSFYQYHGCLTWQFLAAGMNDGVPW
jgi:hypothetical protein